MYSIKDDGVLGRLNFVSKGEDNQVYGISIPNVMLSNDIKNSKAYQTYLAISTSIVVLKKERKAMKAIPTPTKKGSITVEKNILSDSNEALKLGESISLNEAEIAEEEQEQEKTEQIIFCNRFVKDQVKDLVLNQRFSMSQRANPQAQVKELVLHQSDDERTESEREVAKSDKANDETSDEKEMHTNEEEHVDDETANDEEEVHENEEMHDAYEIHAHYEEIVDAKKVDNEQAEVTATDSSTMLLRLSELERKVEALSKVDHSKVIEESIQANVRNEVRNQIPKFLPKAMSEFINPRIESTVHDVL
ncbi:hypothetical protein Tco_1304143 [Tanacetum coccineum]